MYYEYFLIIVVSEINFIFFNNKLILSLKKFEL
jgi:hypothetical protein